jgi:hypothetical protein
VVEPPELRLRVKQISERMAKIHDGPARHSERPFRGDNGHRPGRGNSHDRQG